MPRQDQSQASGLDRLPAELVHMISSAVTSREDLLSLSLASRRYLRITNQLVTFCATAAGKDQLRTVATALDWSPRVRHRMATLVLSDTAPLVPSPPPTDHAASPPVSRTPSDSTGRSAGSSTTTSRSKVDAMEASNLMLAILTRAKNVRDLQITGYCLDLLLLTNQLATRARRLIRFAFNPNPPSSSVDPSLLPWKPTHFEHARVVDLLRANTSLRKLHVRNLLSGGSADAPSPSDVPGRPPVVAAPLTVLDLNRPLIVDSELVELLHAHAATLEDVCVVFHEGTNRLTPRGVQDALRPCAGRLLSLHLGFNRSTRYPIEDVLPGDLHFTQLENVASCAIIMPSLRRFRQFPKLRILRTNSLALTWLNELSELADEDAVPPSLKVIGVIHRPAVQAEGETLAQICERKGLQLRYWAPEAAAQSLL